MSRVGKHPVLIPSGVTVAVDGQRVHASGKQGTLDRTLMREVRITREDNKISIRPRDDSLRARMMWGTARTLVANLVEGVSQGFSRKLEITGVGYRVQVQGNTLVMQLGYSHDVRYPAPEGISIQSKSEHGNRTEGSVDEHRVPRCHQLEDRGCVLRRIPA